MNRKKLFIGTVLAAVLVVSLIGFRFGPSIVEAWDKVNFEVYKLRAYIIEATNSKYPLTVKSPIISGSPSFESGATTTANTKLRSVNKLKNSLLAVWSGGTVYTSGASIAPDYWTLRGVNTGVSRIDSADVAYGTGATVYPGFPHSMLIQIKNHYTPTGYGNTGYVVYGQTGVTSAVNWYKQFAGKRVAFGAWVYRDSAPYSAVTTWFARPFIGTYAGTNYLAGETSFAFGPYHTNNGWQLLTAVTTVPNAATALECGFALNPTIKAGADGVGGDSVYVCAPFLAIDPMSYEYIPVPKEVIDLETPLVPWTGASLFGAKLGNSAGSEFDLSSANNFNGIIPDSVDAMYVMSQALLDDADVIHYYGDSIKSGITFWGASHATGATQVPVWLPISQTGTFTIDNVGAVSGVSLQVMKLQMRD